MKYHIFLKVNYQFDPFIEVVDKFIIEENGNLKLYDEGKFWLFPASTIQYLFITEIKRQDKNNGNDI